MGTGLVGIFLSINMILLTISLVDKFLKLNFKVASQVSLTWVTSSETTDMLFSITWNFYSLLFCTKLAVEGPQRSYGWRFSCMEYATQFAKDMESFLFPRAQELVIGGLLEVIIPAAANAMSNWDTFTGTELDLLGYCLMDMAKVVRKRIFSSSSLTLFGEILDKLGVNFNKLK